MKLQCGRSRERMRRDLATARKATLGHAAHRCPFLCSLDGRCTDVPNPYLGASPTRDPPKRVESDSYWPGPGGKVPPASKRFELPNEYCGDCSSALSILGEYMGPGDASSGFVCTLRDAIVYLGASPMNPLLVWSVA